MLFHDLRHGKSCRGFTPSDCFGNLGDVGGIVHISGDRHLTASNYIEVLGPLEVQSLGKLNGKVTFGNVSFILFPSTGFDAIPVSIS